MVSISTNTQSDSLSESSTQQNQRVKQKQKIEQDALELARLIYDIFKDSEPPFTIVNKDREEDKNVR